MTWKERRLITFLSIVLLILTAAVVIVLGIRFRENRAAEEASAPASAPAALPADDPNAPAVLAYDNGATSLSFSRDENGVWRWDPDKAFPLDDAVILEILDLMENWAPQQVLTDAESLENSGLDEPTGSISVTTRVGDTTSLLFGKTTDDGASYYMRLNGDESTVYIIAGTLFGLMEVPIYDMCVLPELPELEEAVFHTITIRGASQVDGEETIPGPVTILSAQKEERDGISWRSNGANVSDDPTVRALLEDLTALAFTKCVDYNPSDEAATICGFDAPAAELSILYVDEENTDQTLKLAIGNRLPDGSGRYTRLGDDPTIYLLATELLDPLMRLSTEGLEG